MSDTYSRCIIQIVFAVKFRKRQIQPKWKDQLNALMAGLINRRYHRCLVVNSVYDHIHILVSLGPQQAISDLVHDIKRASSNWINNFPDFDARSLGKFRLQEVSPSSPTIAVKRTRYIAIS